MNKEEKKYVKNWLEKANEDIQVALLIIKEDIPLTGPVCFHCQQAAEKFFKAFLTLHRIDFPKTHNLDYLHELCKKINAKMFENIDTKDLNAFGVDIRYPGDIYHPTVNETKQYIEIARQIKNIVEAQIRKKLES